MFPFDDLSTLIILQSNVSEFLNIEATAKWNLTKWRSHRRHIIQNKTPFFDFMIRNMIKRFVITLSIITTVRNYYILLFINKSEKWWLAKYYIVCMAVVKSCWMYYSQLYVYNFQSNMPASSTLLCVCVCEIVK